MRVVKYSAETGIYLAIKCACSDVSSSAYNKISHPTANVCQSSNTGKQNTGKGYLVRGSPQDAGDGPSDSAS